MGSIITSKPKRGRGTIKVDQDHAKRQGAVQSLKNLYQKPISAMVKAPAWGMAAAIATPTFINRALNKDSYVQDYTRKRLLNLKKGLDQVWDIDIWKGDHEEGSKSYMQSGEVIKKSKIKEK